MRMTLAAPDFVQFVKIKIQLYFIQDCQISQEHSLLEINKLRIKLLTYLSLKHVKNFMCHVICFNLVMIELKQQME